MKTSLLTLILSLSGALVASAQPTSIANLSTRGQVGQDAGSLISGFVVSGTAAKNVLIRGVGQGLADYGVANAASDVNLRVYDSAGNLVGANDGYQNDPDAAHVADVSAQVGAFALTHSGDSAALLTLAPGSYTVEIAPDATDAPSGSAMLEVYDADGSSATGSIIANLSTRGLVGQDSGSLIAGFVVSGTAPKNLLIRGVGPDLGLYGLPNPAADVDIRVYDSAGNLVADNSGFLNTPNLADLLTAFNTLGAFPLINAGNSAVLVSLPPGAYTIEVAPNAANTTNGVALLEVYDADSLTPPPAGN